MSIFTPHNLHMPDAERTEALAYFLGGLDAAVRLDIIKSLLEHAELRPTDLAMETGVPQANLSYHLKEMCDRELLEVDKEGRERFYRLRQAIVPTLKTILSL